MVLDYLGGLRRLSWLLSEERRARKHYGKGVNSPMVDRAVERIRRGVAFDRATTGLIPSEIAAVRTRLED